MGCWGLGIAQSDEFCECYDDFMDEYDNGKAVSEITAAILAEYRDEFDDDDGVMHDIYFALAKAEWMCCEQSEFILNRVKEIIESGANIEFFRELEATESDLKVRRKNLEKFLDMLLVPREQPRKRKRTAPAPEKSFSPLEIGDCFAYKFDTGYRVMCILERFKPWVEKEQVTVTIFHKVYSASELKTVDFHQEETGCLFTVSARDFLGASVIKKVSHITVSQKKRARLLGVSSFMYGDKQSFRSEIKQSLGVSLNEFLYHCEENPSELIDSLEVGGCYAYKYKDGYKFAVVLDQATFEETEYRLIATLSAISDIPCMDFLNTQISSISMYDRDTLPNLRDWNKVATIDVPKNMQRKCFGKDRYITHGILDFLQDISSIENLHRVFKTLAPLLKVCRDNTQTAFDSLEAGNCYAFRVKDGYRFAIILDRFNIHEDAHVLVVVLRKTFLSAYADCMNECFSHIGVYSAVTFPNIEEWMLTHELALPSNINNLTMHITEANESILKFFSTPSYYPNTFTLSQFLRLYLLDKS